MSFWGLEKFDKTTPLDAVGHLAAGWVVLLPFLIWPNDLGAFGTGCLIGLYREVDQFRRNRKLNLLDRLLDVFVTGIGCELGWRLYPLLQTLWDKMPWQ